MGLLTQEEQERLVSLLLKLPNRDDPMVRNQLLGSLPPNIRDTIGYNPAPKPHFHSIVRGADADLDEPYPEGWPVLGLVRSAIFCTGATSPLGARLRAIEVELSARAEKWKGIGNLAIFPPQETWDLERLISREAGFQDPVPFRDGMSRSERAVCFIEFKGYTPEGQGTGFLLSPNLVITNYHVMEGVIKGEVAPEKVQARFDYKKFSRTESDEAARSRGCVYALAGNWQVAQSTRDELDFALIRLEGTPGNEPAGGIAESPPRGWLKPRKHEFPTGEPLWIIQHPNGESLKIAVGVVKALRVDLMRVAYKTNTLSGSSGSPCFTADWELVALHQGYLRSGLDPEEPNKGIPFNYILEHPEIQNARIT